MIIHAGVLMPTSLLTLAGNHMLPFLSSSSSSFSKNSPNEAYSALGISGRRGCIPSFWSLR